MVIGGVEVIHVGINGLSRQIVDKHAHVCPVGLAIKGCCGYPPSRPEYVAATPCGRPGFGRPTRK
jgi:hypothetical protein